MATSETELAPVREAAARVARSYGLEIFDLQFRREGIGWVLRVIVDRSGGPADAAAEEPVSIEDCQRVSQDLSALLDVESALSRALDRQYTLEVSSPGLDRPLRGEADYRRFTGRLAKIVTDAPVDGQSHFEGRLTGVDAGEVIVTEGRRVHRIPLDRIRRARLEVEFYVMATELQQMIEVVAKDKGIDPTIVITAIEDAYLAAARKVYRGDEDLRTRFNLESGQVELYAVRQIVPEMTAPAKEISLEEARQLYGDEAEIGMEIEFPKETDKLGRIAAQTAKQVIAQRVREAEREKIHGEFSQRVGEVVNATVKRFESGDLIAEIGRVEAQIPRKEQSRAENYAIGDRVRAVIKAVTKNAKGPQVVLSRTDPALLIKLFEQEVPEIYDGTVMIRGAVREAGDRAKVAVFSRERDVDPVGACVGMRGTRVQAIIRELRGEKIDIVEWSEDPVQFVTKALSPARVQRVSIVDSDERVMEVVVEDRQLSLAIGKKGQNVRLAAKLTGWKIDIKSEEERRKEVEAQLAGIDFGSGAETARPLSLSGIHIEVVTALKNAGYDTAEKILDASPEALAALPGFDAETVEAVRAAAEAERGPVEAAPADEAPAEGTSSEAAPVEPTEPSEN